MLIKNAVEEFIEYGIGHVNTVGLHDNFDFCHHAFPLVSPLTKAEYSWPEKTDGFFKFGGEKSNTTNQIDLCERFCVRRSNLPERGKYWFANCWFAKRMQMLENDLYRIAGLFLEELQKKLCHTSNLLSVDTLYQNSYVQLSYYKPDKAPAERTHLQDRHEDGHLFTIIMENRPGFSYFAGEKEFLAGLKENQLVIFPGSMLTLLTDGKIQPCYHAVKNLQSGCPRSSLAFFAIPELGVTYNSWFDKKPVDLKEHANRLHQSFGNKPFTEMTDDGIGTGVVGT